MKESFEKEQEELEKSINEAKKLLEQMCINQCEINTLVREAETEEEHKSNLKLTEYENKINEKWEKYEKNKDSTIMLIGSTGCGKSSLINNILGTEVAEVSYTDSITRDFKIYTGKDFNVPLNLIDSRGYELKDKVDDYFQSLKSEIGNLNENGINVDLVWYCISLGKRRIEDFDIKLLHKIISENLFKSGVCIVITQCDHDTEDGEIFKKLEKVLTEEFTLPIFQVSNDPEVQADRGKLISWSTKEIGNMELINKFMEKERTELLLKKLEVEDSLKKYTAMAAGVGATPIPFSDAALLIPIQMTMITSIIKKYGLKNFATISKAVVSDIIIGNIGKSVAGGLFKLIPGVGTILGGVISAGVASAITYGLGKATSEICYNSCLKINEGKNVDLNEIFNDEEQLNEETKKFSKEYKK